MTLSEAIETVVAGKAERVAAPGEWRVYRSEDEVLFELAEDGWTPRPVSAADQA